jgi:hypothetical protein
MISNRSMPPGTIIPELVYDDLNAAVDWLYEHVKTCQAHILHPPETYPFGERQYTVDNIGDHRWTFTQSVADVAPEDWGGQLG